MTRTPARWAGFVEWLRRPLILLLVISAVGRGLATLLGWAFGEVYEAVTENNGIAGFDQPVLDTLLLSAVVHPAQESHRLEAIAERLGVVVQGRHTALGDAIVTAEVFLKLIPLLAAQGIHTLGQAREAAQRTYYARVKY